MTPPPDISALIDRLTRLARLEPHERHLIGLTGAPGVGKSTVSARLVDQLGSKVAVVPMDGFHLASSVIAGTPREGRRGAPDTFDADGFVALLLRLRDQFEPVVYAPTVRPRNRRPHRRVDRSAQGGAHRPGRRQLPSPRRSSLV